MCPETSSRTRDVVRSAAFRQRQYTLYKPPSYTGASFKSNGCQALEVVPAGAIKQAVDFPCREVLLQAEAPLRRQTALSGKPCRGDADMPENAGLFEGDHVIGHP
jgi:hypothetical protein